MFDIARIGQYIAFLRKNKNMTQAQLAEMLGVSHQAVSNWERGEAMPDISLLTRLAKALNTTTDRILLSGGGDLANEATPASVNNEPEAVQSDTAVNRDTDENVKAADTALQKDTHISCKQKSILEKQNAIRADISLKQQLMPEKQKDIRELESTLDILRAKMGDAETQSLKDRLQELIDAAQEQIDGIREETEDLQEEIDDLREEIDDLQEEIDEIQDGTEIPEMVQLAPFLERQTIDKIIADACVNMDKIDWKILPGLAPFASKEVLDLIVTKLDGNAGFHVITSLAPFLGRDALEKLLLRSYNGGEKPDWNAIMGIAPFVSSEALDILTSKLEENCDFENIRQLAPFLRSSTIERLILDAAKGGGKASWAVVRDLAPFTGKNVLDTLVTGMEDSIKWQQVMELAPFLSRSTIDRQIMNKKRS